MFVSLWIVRAMLAELSTRDVGSERLLEAAQLERGLLEASSRTLPARDFARLVRAALTLSGDPALGLSLGTGTSECALHALSHLVLAAPSLRAACSAATRYASTLAGTLSLQLREQGELAVFGYSCAEPEHPVPRFGAEFALALALNLARRISDGPLPLQEVWFMHAAPAHAERYAQVFGCPLRFKQPLHALVIAREALDRPRAYADAALSTALSSLAEQLIIQPTRHDALSARVAQALRYEPDLAHVDFERIARRWGMTRRTLRRRLKLEGKQLTELLDEARFQQASRDLGRPHESIKEIAERLGYAEPSSFHRAFKRWAGMGPAEYRKRAAHAPRLGAPLVALGAETASCAGS